MRSLKGRVIGRGMTEDIPNVWMEIMQRSVVMNDDMEELISVDKSTENTK